MRTVYSLYRVEFIRTGVCELVIEATSRRGSVYVAQLKQLPDGYWEGGSDFGFSGRKKFKGIIVEFLQHLMKEARDYDKRWYDMHCMVRVTDNRGQRPLTWEETYRGGLVNEAEPTFKAGVTFKNIKL